jgi:molecular chaperone GrpE
MAQPTEEASCGPDEEKNELSGVKLEESSPGAEELQRRYEELNNRFLRLAADFENYKRRVTRETESRVTRAIEEFAVDLLEVVDNFERALAAEDSSAREGLEQISKLFESILARHGIRRLESVGRVFDPSEHEAITTVPSDHEEGQIIDEICAGYCMNEKIIRCARVAVSKGKKTDNTSESE